MNWKQEYQEICEVINQTPESRLKKDRLKKEIKKTLQNAGGIDYNKFPPDFRWNLCAARMRLGRFHNYDGWEFRSDWSITFQGFNGYDGMKVAKWYGEEDVKIIILGEQGIGDEILFSSALPDLIVRIGPKRIEYQTYPRIIPIMERSLKIKCVPRMKLGDIPEDKNARVVALADLFAFYRRDKSHFPKKPFLKPNMALVDKYLEKLNKLGDKPKIGIAWKARHGDIDPKDLMCEDAIYINLQYLKHPDGNWEEPLPEGVTDIGGDPLESMEEHMALIWCLDKVVTVTQTTVHEAGSMGVECHAIRPRKGTGEVHNMLWYYGLGNCDHHVYGNVKIWNTPKDYEAWTRNKL